MMAKAPCASRSATPALARAPELLSPDPRSQPHHPGTQQEPKTFEAAAAASIDLIVQVKGNQPTLHQHIQIISATAAPLGSTHSHDKGRNRDERRTVTVFGPADGLAGTDWQPHVAAVIRVERDVYTRSAATGLLRHAAETAFYVANAPLTAACAAKAIRAHWAIENTSHHRRDVTLGEGIVRLLSSGRNDVRGPGWHDDN